MLEPIFFVPFKFLTQIGPIAYQLALPTNLKIHKKIYVSLLQKYIHGTTHIIYWNIGTSMHSSHERNNTSEQIHCPGKSAMEAHYS
jgi:hypothetical protein